MAVLTAARNTLKRGTWDKNIHAAKVGNDIVYAGGLVSSLAVAGTGVILAGQDTDNHRFIGVALETVDGTGGDTPLCDVATEGEFLFTGTFTTADVYKDAVILDDQTIGTSGSSNTIFVGVITEYVDATHAWVQLGGLKRAVA